MMKKIFYLAFAFIQAAVISVRAQVSIDDVQVDSVTCNGLSDGKIHVTISGGTPPYIYILQRLFPNPQTYSQTNSSTNVTFTNLEVSNLYKLTVLDDNGSGSPVEYGPYISVKQPPVLTVNITSSSAFCVNSNVQLHGNPTGGNGSYTHTWSGTGAAFLNQTDIENPVFNCNVAGSYTLKYKAEDFKGCADSMEINITVNNLPSVTFGGSLTPQCANSTTYALTGGSPAGGTYSGPGVSGTNFNASASGGPGTKVLTYTYTDGNGCSNSATNTIDVLALPSASASNNGPVCEGSTLQLFGSGSGTAPISYQWSGPLGYTSTSQNPIVSTSATVAMSGTYTLTVTDGNSCTNQATTAATVIASPANPTGLTNQSRCGNGTLSFTASAANANDSIQWSYDGSTVVFTAKTPAVFTTGVLTAPSTITVYARVKSVSGGCLSGWVSATGNVYTNPTAVPSSNSPVCEGSTLTLSALPNGMATYSWTGPNGFSSSSQNPTVTSSATSAHAGTYTLTVVDGNGCSDIKNTTVTVNLKPTVFNVTGGGSYCAGGSGVPVGLSGSQTGVNYQLKRNGNNTGSPVPGTGSALNFGLQTLAGTYTVEATNASTGCTATMNGSAVVIVNTPPTPTASNNGPVCQGNTLSLSGLPSSGVTYQWSGPNGFSSTLQNPVVSSSATPAMSGTYKLVITDSNGCKDSTTTSATVYAKPAVTVSSNSPVCGLNTLELYGGPNGMTSYSWSGPFGYTSTVQNPTRPNALPSFGGYYKLTITDSNGCSNTDSTSVTVYAPANISYNLTDPTVCYYEDAVVTLSGSQSGGYQYTIFRESDNVQVTLPQNGNGASLQFTIPAASILNVGSNQFYCLIVTPQGCPYTVTNRAIVTKRAEVQKNLSTSNALCFGLNGSITTSPTGGTSPYTMSITGPSGSFGALSRTVAPGSYQVVVKDANSCLSTTTPVTITQPNKITFSVDSASPSCSGSNDGHINFINVTGGTTPYQYSIRGNDPGEYSSNPNFSSLAPDIYYAIVKDVNGCLSDSITVPLNQGGQIFVGHSLAPALVCYGDSGQLTLSASGGSGNYQFSVSTTAGVPGPWTSNTVFKIRGGINYYGFARDVVTGCVGYANNGNPVSIASAPPVVIVINSIVAATCYNTADGRIHLGNSSGGKGGPYTYYVDGVSNGTRNFTNLLPGNHTILVVGAGGCSEDSVVNVPSPPAIVYDSITTVDLQCANDMLGEIHIHNPSGGTPPLQYTINTLPYGSSTNFTGLDGGTYDVKIRDAIGCINSTLVTLNEPAPFVLVDSLIGNITCNGLTNGQVGLTVSGGTTPYTFTLKPNNITAQSNGSYTFTGLTAGKYMVEVTDAHNCATLKTFDSLEVKEPSVISIDSVTKIDALCSGASNGEIRIYAKGGTVPYTYTVTSGSNNYTSGSNVFTGLPAGNYNISVTDVNNCPAATAGPVTINAPTAIVWNSITLNHPSCNNSSDGSINAVASGGTGTLQYWLDMLPLQPTGNFTGLNAGTHQLHVIDANSCQKDTTVTLNNPAPITITSAVGDTVCTGGTGTISVVASGGTAPLTYTLTPGPLVQGSGVFTGLSAGTYNISVTDSKGCPSADTTLSIVTSVGVNIQVTVQHIKCKGNNTGSIVISASGGVAPYQYSINGDVPSQYQNSPTFTNLSAGTYDIYVKDVCGSHAYGNVTLNEPATVLTINSVNAIPVSGCKGSATGAIVINASGGSGTLQYSINGGGSFQTSNIFNNLLAGNYNIVVQDDSLCQANTSTTITEPNLLKINNISTTKVNGPVKGTATVNVPPATSGAGNLVYWYNNIPPQASNVFTNLDTGTYMAYVRDQNMCVDSMQFVITDTLGLVVNITTTPVTCYGGTDGRIDTSISGGVPPYNFMIVPSVSDLTHVSAGNYQITVTDANMSTVTQNVTVTQPAPVSATYTITGYNGTPGTGSIVVNGTGGNGGYQYSFNNGPFSPTNTFTDLTPGFYRVVTRDGMGCSGPDTTIEIVDDRILSLYPSTYTDVACYGSNSGTATVHIKSGTPPFTIRLRKGSTTIGTVVTNLKDYTFTNLSAGSYQFNVRHFYSPPSVNSEVFTINELATSLLNITNVTTAPQTTITPNGEIHITASGGVGSMASYEFSIDGGANFTMNAGNFTGLVGDSTYNIAVKDLVGCIIYGTAYVPYGLPLNVQFSKTNETCTGLSDGTIRYKVISGRKPYTYSFNGSPYVPAPDSFTFTMLPPGSYTLDIVDANNDTASYVATIDPASPVVIDNITATPSSGNNGTLTVNVSGGSGIFSFTATSYHNGIFTNGSNNVFTGLPADTFIVRVDDICSFAEQTAIVPRDTILLANVSIDPVKCIQPFLQAFINIEPLNAAPGLVTYEAVHAVTSDYYVQFNNGNVEVNDTGTYYIHVFDSQGKHFRDTVTVTSIVTQLVVVVDPIIQPCTTGGTTNIFINVTGGQAPYTYRWYKLPNFSTVISTQKDLLNVGEGKYSVVVTDAFGCSVQKLDSVVVSGVKILNITATKSTCNVGLTDGTITVTAIGRGTLQYIWDGGVSASPVITGVGAGTYTVTAVNESGCSDSRVVSVASNDSLMNLWTFDNQTCIGEGFIQYDVSLGHPDYTFIQVGYDTLVTSSASYRRTLVPGSYTFKLIDQKGCYDTIHVDILPKPAFDTIVIDSVQVVKSSGANGSITVYATGTYPPLIYKITSASTAATINNGTNNVFSGLMADTYYIEVTDFSACAFAYDTVTVGLDTALNVAITIRDSVCNGAVVYLTPLNAYGRVSYEITTDSVNFFINHISDSVFTVSHTGWYRIQVSDQAGKTFRRDTFIVVTSPGLFATVDSTVYPECNVGTSGSIYMRVGGGTPPYTYLWKSVTTGDTISVQQLNLIDAPLGRYAFTVNDNAGCSFTHFDSIVVSEVAVVAIDTVKSNCSTLHPTGKITVTARGRAPFYFLWLNLSDLTIVKEGTVATNKDSIVNVPAGRYMVRIIDANNCISADTAITLEAYNPLRGTIALLEMPKCYSVSDPTPEGIISVQMQNGNAPYTYNWVLMTDTTLIRRVDSTYVTADTLTGAFSATYRVIVRDSNFCFFDTLYSIPAKDSIDFDVQVLNHATCTVLGSVVIRFTKGTKPFAYQWLGQPFDTIAADSVANNALLAGNYPFTLVDDSGCMVTKPVIVQQSEYFKIDSVIAYEKCNAFGSVALQLSQTAYPAYLKWFDEGDTLVLNSSSDLIPLKDGLTAGLYNVRVWNNIGCDTIKTFLVRMDDTLRIDKQIVSESCTSDGSIEIKVLNSSYPFRYQWLGTDTVITKVNSDTIRYVGKNGTYIIAIWTQDHRGCDRLDTLVIPFDNPLIVDAGPDTTICRGKEYVLQGKAYSGRLLGATEALYNWSPVQNLLNNKGNIPNPVIKPYIPNSYNIDRVEYVLNVTLDRCHKSDTVIISYYPSNGVWLPAVDTAARGEYQIIPVIGGTGTYVRYMWTPRMYVLYNSDTSRVLSLNFQGDSLTYYFTGITPDGCYEKASVLIVASPDIKPDDAFTPNGDGINDFWYIPRAEYFPDIHVRVFNRWGDIVYESIGYNNVDKVWNGKRKGKDLPIGTYYYVITMSGGKTAKGTVAIIR